MLTKETVERSLASLPKESPTVTETPAVANPELNKDIPVIKVDVPPVVTSEAKTTVETKAPETNSELQALLKELNISSVDELKKKVATPEKEVKKSREQKLSEALDYGIKNEKLKLEDYNEAIRLQSIPPKELVFKKFAEGLKEKNPKITDEQIQAKFNRKYGEEVETKETNDLGEPVFQTIFDEDELKAEAESIIKKAWSPIDSIEKEYSAHTENQTFLSTLKKDADNFTSQIPSVIKLSIGEDSIDYTIDEKTKEKIAEDFGRAYVTTQMYLKDKGKPNENFDFTAALEEAVWRSAKNNIIGVYVSNKVEEAKRKELQPFTNTTTKPIETTSQDGKKAAPESLIEIGQRFAASKRGF